MRTERTGSSVSTAMVSESSQSATTGEVGGNDEVPEPAALRYAGGDIGAEIAALLIKTSKASRDTATTMRHAAEKAEDAENHAQLDELREKAGNILTSGIISGVGKAIAAALTCVGASTKADAGAKEAEAKAVLLSKAPELAPPIADAAKALQKTSANYELGAKMTDAHAGFVGKAYESTQVEHDVRAKQHEQAASHATSARADAKQQIDDANKMIQTAVDFYREFSAARSSANSAALHRA